MRHPGGRPKGVQCQHIRERYEPHCKKSARVRIVLEISGTTGVRRISSTRCWEHYVALENNARKTGSPFRIISVRILRSEV